jgi:8-oxo-dGTP pyrophosphatase MutT (NUDIX family)
MEKEEILEFGIKRDNEERRDGGFAIIFDPKNKLYAVGKHLSSDFLYLFGGGRNERENKKDGIIREVKEESGLHDFLHVEEIGEAMVHYFHSIKKINRITKATCFLIVLDSTSLIDTEPEEHENFSLTWVKEEDLFFNWRNNRDDENQPHHWIYFMEKASKRLRDLGFVVTNF